MPEFGETAAFVVCRSGDAAVPGEHRFSKSPRKRLLDFSRRFGPVLLATLLSQSISAFALLSIVILGSSLSDNYALAIQVGLSAFSGVVLQVLYLVAIGRPWIRSWSGWYWATALFSLLFTLGVIAVIGAIDGIALDSAITIAIFGAGGAFLGVAGVRGVRFACLGQPLVMASLTIAPSAFLAIGSLIVGAAGLADGGGKYIPATLWAIACILVWAFNASRQLPAPPAVPIAEDQDRKSQMLHTATLAVGLIGNTIYPSLFIAALARLPEGGTTALFLVSRVGTSVVGLFVNSILTVRYNWSTEVPRSGPAVFWLASGAVTTGVAGLLAHAAGTDQLSFVLTALCWLAALVAAPLLLREINARRMVLANAVKTVADLVVVVAIGTWFIAAPSTSGFFGVYVALQAATLISCAVPLRRPAIAVASGVLLTVGLAQVLVGW